MKTWAKNQIRESLILADSEKFGVDLICFIDISF